MTDASRPLIDARFSESPAVQGWRLRHESVEALGQWSQDAGAVSATVGLWESPGFAVTEQDWYRVTINGAFAGEGLAIVQFYDVDGRQTRDDHATGFDTSDEPMTHEFYFRGKTTGVESKIRVFSLGRDASVTMSSVRVERSDAAAAAAWSDRVYAGMPKITFPGGDVTSRLTKTQAKLKAGGELRVVLLGDSIANDTGSSPWDAIVERAHPGVEVTVITSVRGGTGAWYYQEPGRVQSFVLDHKPDLVVVMGVSHKQRLEPIADVIQQIKAGCDADILLMNGGVTLESSEMVKWERISEERAAESVTAFAKKLNQLAADEGLPFFDLRAAWRDYVTASPKPAVWYRRDIIHANARGRQFLGRTLAALVTGEE